MKELEDKFHPQRVKHSKAMSKLEEYLCTEKAKSTEKAEACVPLRPMERSVTISKPTTVKFDQLNVIGEVEEDLIHNSIQNQRKNKLTENTRKSLNMPAEEKKRNINHEGNRRSGTAQGTRRKQNQNFTVDFQRGRPKTGVYRSSDRYYRTVEDETNNNQQKQVEKILVEGKRKSFYDDLQRQCQAETIYENQVKIPKKKSASSHRWSFKINRFF